MIKSNNMDKLGFIKKDVPINLKAYLEVLSMVLTFEEVS